MKKINIALVAGGDSGEYEVSIASAAVVKENLDSSKYNVYTIVLRGKEWYYEKTNKRFPVNKADFTLNVEGKKITFDLAFIVIHGTPGEDGKLQGYFDLMNIPYTTTDLFTSAVTFKKSFTNAIVAQAGVNVARSVSIGIHEIENAASKCQHLKLPLFVKPNKGGSSVGISKVNTQDSFRTAVNKAFEQDSEILIEEFIEGRELACGIIKADGELLCFPITEIISKNDFFDYEAKYTPGLADEITPAKISKEEVKLCNETSRRLYEHLDCRGLVRFDFFLTTKGLYFLEVNTIPGLSAASIIPKQIQAMGKTAAWLYDTMIREALK